MTDSPLFLYTLRLADTALINGHRLSEWCGQAPVLEEELALANVALDLIGQARSLYAYAGEVEGKGRDEDGLAYLRDVASYRHHPASALDVGLHAPLLAGDDAVERRDAGGGGGKSGQGGRLSSAPLRGMDNAARGWDA
jgi:hypothetical protein